MGNFVSAAHVQYRPEIGAGGCVSLDRIQLLSISPHVNGARYGRPIIVTGATPENVAGRSPQQDDGRVAERPFEANHGSAQVCLPGPAIGERPT